MSLFAKVLNRAAVPGVAAPAPAWPKGGTVPAHRHASNVEIAAPPPRTATQPSLHRQEEEEEAQPLRRQEEEKQAQPLRRQEEEEAAQPLRRQEEEEEAQPLRRQEEEQEAQPLHRQEEEEEAQPLRRQEEEEEAQALRRQEEEEEAQPLHRREEEEEAQPLRRQQEEEEEELQALRRIGINDPIGPVPVDPLPATEEGPQEELPDMRALRRAAESAISVPGAATAPDLPSVFDGPSADPFGQPAFDPPGADLPLPTPQQAERPRVTIDQIDVVIQDTAPAKSTAGPSLTDLSRRMNSLYLRGL